MKLQTKYHLKTLPRTDDGPLTGLLISQFIHWMTLTIGIHRGSFSTYFHIIDYHCFVKTQCFTCSYSKSQGTKSDLHEKWVKVNLELPLEQNWKYSVTWCYLSSFKILNPVVQREEGFFLRFLPCNFMIMGAILAMWPGPFEQILDPLLPGCCIWNLTEIGPAVSEEKLFENVDKHSIPVTISQGHWMTLTFGIQQVYKIPTFISQTTIVLVNCNVSPFPHPLAARTKSDIDKNGSRST